MSHERQSNTSHSLHVILAAQIAFALQTVSHIDRDALNALYHQLDTLIREHGRQPSLFLLKRLAASIQHASSPNSLNLLARLLKNSQQQDTAQWFAQALAGLPPKDDFYSSQSPASDDDQLANFNLGALLGHVDPSSDEPTFTPLERLSFAAEFLPFLVAPHLSPALGQQAAHLIRSALLHPALAVLRSPAAASQTATSPLALAHLVARLLSSYNPEMAVVLGPADRQALLESVVRHRLGPDLGAKALAHAVRELTLPPGHGLGVVDLLARVCTTPEACSSDLVAAVLNKLLPADGTLDERQAAIILSDLVALASAHGENVGLDLGNVVRGMHDANPALRWGDALRLAFDRPWDERPPPEGWGVRLLAALLVLSPSPLRANSQGAFDPANANQLVSAQGGTSAITGLVGAAWQHHYPQLALIDQLVQLPEAGFSFGTLSGPAGRMGLTKIVGPSLPPPAAQGGADASDPWNSQTIRALVAAVQNSMWNCAELVGTLVGVMRAQEGEVAGKAREVLERACKTNPELVLIGLVGLEKPWSHTLSEFVARLLSTFLAGHPAHQLVFLRLFQLDRAFLAAALRDYYDESSLNVSRILDIAQDVKGLDWALELRPFAFAFDLAALASRRDYLNLDKWLNDQIAALPGPAGMEFIRASLAFVQHKVQHDLHRQALDPQPEPTTLSLSAATTASFMRVLRGHHERFEGEDVELFKEVRTAALQLYPRLMNFKPPAPGTAQPQSGGIAEEPGMSVVVFTPDIESEVDAYYKKMYDLEIPIDRVVNALRRAKESDNVHDHEFLACFLHGLFDEHRFFNTYPPNELSLTARLFGDLIQFKIIDSIPLGIAVRYVLDALRNSPESNWYRFGILALERFQARLVEWPQLAHSILSIPHLALANPDLANVAREALRRREAGEWVPNSATGAQDGALEGGAGAAQAEQEEEQARPVFTAIKLSQRKASEEPSAPDEEVSDKMLFIMNNLAPTNFDAKLAEMVVQIRDSHFEWFAHYLVSQRVSIEPNNHELYLNFLDALKLPKLVKHILDETYIKLGDLLNQEKTVQSSTERTLLKNLGSWLGGLTLAKDKPIRHQDLAIKDLLVQGYDNNRLIVAIPFVCKVLEQCSKSRVFKLPNPWLMNTLRLLSELYQLAELKLNLKFEIEVLCKKLSIELKDVTPTESLKNRHPSAPGAGGPDLTLAGLGAGGPLDPLAHAALLRDAERGDVFASSGLQHQQHLASLVDGGRPQSRALGTSALATRAHTSGLSLQDTITAALRTLPTYMTFSPQAPIFSSNPSLKRLVHVAADRAIREIIAPVVERSVTIAGISTRELTTKDFAMEGDEEKMATATHLMVQHLAGSLALVTCKEPLRISLVAHIRALLMQNGFSEQSVPEQQIIIVAADNLDLACSVVEKVAMEKAVAEVDEGLASAYHARRAHRERSREAFWDTAAMAASHYSGMLPDPLRLKLGGLQPQQLQVYEDFAHVRSTPVYDIRTNPEFANEEGLAGQGIDGLPLAPPQALTSVQATEKFSALVAELDKALAGETSHSLSRLPVDHAARQVVDQIPLVAASAINLDETALAFSQKVVQLLFRTEAPLAREVYVAILERLCNVSLRVAKEVTAWLVYAEDERKFNVPVTTALVRAQLIDVAEFDVQLAKFVTREYRQSVVDFAARFVAECLTEVPPVASREQLVHSLEALTLATRLGKGTETSTQVVQELAAGASPPPTAKAGPDESALVREQLISYFAEWVRLYQQSFSVEKSFVEFVVQLQNQGILKGEEISSLFFRVCAEVSVDSYIKNMAAGGTLATGIFQPVDAFAKLIVFMIKYHADPTGVNNDKAKVHYMTKVLSIVVLVLAQSHEQLGQHFQQKPFFRFFSSLLSNLNAIEGYLGNAYYQLLVAVSHSVNSLQPLFFPGFTFSWVGLISHRMFMPKLLQMKDKDGWLSFHRQLVSLLRFLAPLLKEGKMSQTTRALYIGTQRVLLVLLHDFPDFLSQSFFALCDAIPTECVQLHNLVLSAFPVNPALRLPDPLQPGLKMELLPEISKSPPLLTDFTVALTTADLKAPLDAYLQNKTPATFPLTLIEALTTTGRRAGGPDFNVPLANSLVMYLGVVAVNQSRASTGAVTFSTKTASSALLQHLLIELEPEARYYAIAAMANQLRYPNAHTYWFSSFLVSAFADIVDELVREQIIRVLLERIVVNRPHSWGVAATFAALMQAHNVESFTFAQRTPELGSIFARVSAVSAAA